MFLWFFMACEIAHFSYNGATVCILTHWQLSAPIRKSSSIHSCAYNQNDKSASSTSLSHFYRGDADLSATVEPVYCLQHKEWIICVIRRNVCTVQTFPVITQENYFESSIPKILLTSQRWRRYNIAFITNTWQMCCRSKWNGNIFLQRKHFQRKNDKKEPKCQANF